MNKIYYVWREISQFFSDNLAPIGLYPMLNPRMITKPRHLSQIISNTIERVYLFQVSDYFYKNLWFRLYSTLILNACTYWTYVHPSSSNYPDNDYRNNYSWRTNTTTVILRWKYYYIAVTGYQGNYECLYKQRNALLSRGDW